MFRTNILGGEPLLGWMMRKIQYLFWGSLSRTSRLVCCASHGRSHGQVVRILMGDPTITATDLCHIGRHFILGEHIWSNTAVVVRSQHCADVQRYPFGGWTDELQSPSEPSTKGTTGAGVTGITLSCWDSSRRSLVTHGHAWLIMLMYPV